MSDDDAASLLRVCNLLVTLTSEIRGLRNDLAGRKSPEKKTRALSVGDTVLLADLLPQISAAIGDEMFSVHSLCEYADAHQAQEKALRKAIDATGDSVQFGHLLKRAAKSGMPVAGLYAHRIDRFRDGVAYRVNTATPEHHAAACIAAALGGTISK